MPIEFHCKSCGRLLRVPDGSGGKKAKCPSCSETLDVPQQKIDLGKPQPTNPQQPIPSPNRAAQRPQQPPTPSGAPTPPTAYPTSQPNPAPYPQQQSAYPQQQAPNPYAAPPQPGYPPSGPAYGAAMGPPHRGGMILAFGIVSLVSSIIGMPCILCISFISPILFGGLATGFGITSWKMGTTDLAKIKRGEVPMQAQSQIQTGYVLGIIGTILGILNLLAAAGLVAFFIFIAMNDQF